MKKLVIVLAVLVAIGAAVWFLFLRSATVEMQWGGGQWPDTVRGVGEATEQVVHEGRGKAEAADRARARERARWKAYYYAQLRLAEQLGGLKIDAHTTVQDAVLEDQEVKAAYSGTVRAAAEKESESTIENLPNAVRARVVVEAPADRVLTLRQAIVQALQSGKISLELAKKESTPPPADAQRMAGPQQSPEHDRGAAAGQPDSETDAALDHESAPAPEAQTYPRPKRKHQPSYTGCVITLPAAPEALVAAPDFYDAAGIFLGSALDLPAKARSAGLPVADPGETDRIREFAGSHPAEVDGTVTAGNIMLTRKLTPEEAQQFARAIRANRVVLVLGKEAG